MSQARLNGTILNDGGDLCEGRFQYGTTIAMGSFTPWQGGALVTGDTFSHLLTGLLGGTMYYFRAEARNAVGEGTPGNIRNFLTSLVWGSILTPVVAVQAPTDITEYAATLNGRVISHGDLPGEVRFHWGAGGGYGMVTNRQSGFSTGDSFTATISGLSPGAAYHCRAEFKNTHGPSVFSGDLSFSTLSLVGGMALAGDGILAILGGMS